MSEIKNKFFQDLKAGLDDANIEDREEILNNYISQYEQKISKGLTDMEVVIALGDPSDIIDALKGSTDSKEHVIKDELNKSVSELIDNKETSKKSLKKDKKAKEKKSKDKNKELKSNVIEGSIVLEDKDSNTKKTSSHKKAKKNNRILVRVVAFICLILLAIIIPLALVNAGLNYINDSSFTLEFIVSLAVGLVCLIIFVFLRRATKNHIIRSN